MISTFFRLLALITFCTRVSSLSAADVRLTKDASVHFATVEEGRHILAAKDDFVTRLSPFDRAARLKTSQAVSESAYLAFLATNVTAWSDTEQRKLESALAEIAPRLEPFALALPKTITLIRTTGREEGNAAYTRSTAIVLPPDEIAKPADALKRMLAHELFHILSRANPALRTDLFGIIGFTKCAEIEFPPSLKDRKLTNPDAPHNDHFITLTVDGKPAPAVPILFSRTEKYDESRGGDFFNYLQFQFLLVEKPDAKGIAKVLYQDGRPRLVSPQSAANFFEQVGKNTQYIIHPEEILADNFSFMVMGGKALPNPELIEKLREKLKAR